MDVTTWAVIVTGVTILIAIGTVSWRLESRLNAHRLETREDLAAVRKRLDVHGEEVGRLRERMARLEGLLEGLRDAITGKRAA